MNPRTSELRHIRKLPPILEIDEDGIPVSEHEGAWGHPRWTSDEDSGQSLQLGDWPTELDD